MKLKTPAAWYRQGTRKRKGEADRRSLDILSLDRSLTAVKTVKSPVELALDKLLGEYIFAFFIFRIKLNLKSLCHFINAEDDDDDMKVLSDRNRRYGYGKAYSSFFTQKYYR